MLKSYIILTILPFLAAGCGPPVTITLYEPYSAAFNEESCTMEPEVAGCSEYLDQLQKQRSFKLERLSPNNSYKGQIVMLFGESFDDKIEITIEGQELEVFPISSTQVFFITPSFSSPGMKSGILKRLETSLEFKLIVWQAD